MPLAALKDGSWSLTLSSNINTLCSCFTVSVFRVQNCFFHLSIAFQCPELKPKKLSLVVFFPDCYVFERDLFKYEEEYCLLSR
jgi:hypothetical protein